MGIQKTNLNNEKIKKIMKDIYGISVTDIKNIDRGTANIFKITDKNKEYILKEFSEGRSKESVIKETNIINFLNKKGVKVPTYVETKNGKYYTEENNRIIILQEYIDGYTMENNTGDYKKTIESATILGKMTKALEDYKKLPDDGIIEKWYSKGSLEKGIVKINDLTEKINNDNPYKEIFIKDMQDKLKMTKYILKEFDFNIINNLTIMNSHGDYSVQQLIYNDKKGTTVIDFETAKSLPIIWEVMRSYSYIDKEAKDGNLNIDTLINYVKEFSKYVKLNKYDLKYAGWLYLIQIVGSTFGYKQYNDDYSKTGLLEFALFRTKLCRYLYNNAEKIGDRLLAEINN